MRLDIIREVFLKELRETLRDRRSLAVMFGIPLLLYPLMTLASVGLGASRLRKMTEQPGRIAVVNPEAAPRLLEMLRRSESSLEVVRVEDARRALEENTIDAVLVLPPDLEKEAL